MGVGDCGAAEVGASLARASLPVSHVTQQEAEGKISVFGIITDGGDNDGRGGGLWKTGCSVEFGQDGCAVILEPL